MNRSDSSERVSYTPDEALIARVLSGEKEAFSVLVERHRRRVFGKCMSLTRDYDAAEDCVQETFLLALERLAQFRAQAQFSTWLLTIAINVAYSHLRRQASTLEREVPIETDSLDSIGMVVVDPREDPEAACCRSELRRRLQAAMRALSPTHRAVVILHYFEELSTRETARILSISENAVKTNLFRARHRMKNKLASWWRTQPLATQAVPGALLQAANGTNPTASN